MNTEMKEWYSKLGKKGGAVKNPKKGFGTLGSDKASAASKLGVEARRKKREENY